MVERTGQKAEPVAEKINQQIITSQVIKSDETSARLEGRNWRQWVFIGESGVYHTIVLTRSASEIATVRGRLGVEAWVCDCYGAHLKALEIPPTNNESEQALRGSVIHRKVTNCFRSKW